MMGPNWRSMEYHGMISKTSFSSSIIPRISQRRSFWKKNVSPMWTYIWFPAVTITLSWIAFPKQASRLRSESKSPRKTRSLATLTPFLPPGQKRKEANLKKLWFLRLPAIPRKRSRRIPIRHSPSGSGADNGTKRIENNSDQWPAVRDFVQWSAVRSVWKCPLQRDDHTQKRNSRTGAGAEK